jgi:succinoglycan biosynthesis protein ExoO
MADPRVSVIIAAFNANPFIGRAIGSVRAQTFGDWEIIVVDDASTDGTGSYVEALARTDERIRVIRLAGNQGPATARNAGIDAARGTWIAILDADDAWRPERLERMIAVAERTGSDLIADNQILFDEGAGKEIGIALTLQQEQTALDLEALLASEYEGTPLRFGLLKPLIRKSFLAERGLRYHDGLRYAEDFHFYAQLLASRAKALLLSDAFYVYTSPVGQLSGERSRSSRTKTMVETRLWIADDLLERYGATLSAREAGEIGAYKERARKRWLVEQITSHRRGRRYLELARLAAAHPGAVLGYVASSRRFKALTGRSAS